MLKQQSLLIRMDQNEEEDLQAVLLYDEEQKKQGREEESKSYYGKGNAKSGQKAKYVLYPPSDAFERVK